MKYFCNGLGRSLTSGCLAGILGGRDIRWKAAKILGAGLWICLTFVPGVAQVNSGRILGRVHEQSGAVVPNAQVVITEVRKNISHTVSTTGSGDYVVPGLPPGVYRVRATAPGFNTLEHEAIELEVGKDIQIDFELKLSQVKETITISGEPSLLDTTSNVLGGTLSNRAINDLPLNGRDYENLVVLRPGIQRTPGGGYLSTSSNGLRNEDLNYVFEGLDNNDPYYGVSVVNQVGINGQPATVLPIDSIQEFNTMESGQADTGYKPGAIISIGLKSGTNQFHGTAYDFERNNAFDARNFFNTKPDPQTPLHFHQFGVTAGGPVIKDKLFFFTAFEGLQDLVGNTFTTTTPATVSLATSGNPAGDPANSIPDAIAGVQAQGLTASPLSSTLAKLFPTNNGTNQAGPTSLSIGFPSFMHQYNGLLKMDDHINDKHSLSGRWFIGNSTQAEQFDPRLSAAFIQVGDNRANVAGVTWTWTMNSRWVNQAQFGYNRFATAILPADSGIPPTAYGINTGVTNPLDGGLPNITVAGFTPLGAFHNAPFTNRPDETYEWVDNVLYLRGSHSIKFGAEIRHSAADAIKDASHQGSIRFLGGLAFPGSTPLEDFVAGFPGDGALSVGNTERIVSINSLYGYILDNWRLASRLNLNLGLRYEFNGPLTEKHNLLANFDPQNGLVQVGQQISQPYKSDGNNFAPRAGIVWDPTGKGTTVLRAGGGLEYEFLPIFFYIGNFGAQNQSGARGLATIPTGALGVQPGGGSINAASLSFSSGQLNWTPAGPVFPNLSPDCSQTTGSPCAILGIDRNFRTPYVVDWNLNLEHSFTKSLALQVGYVGNEGTKLAGIVDINQVNPNSPAENSPVNVFDANGNILACNHCEQAGRPFNSRFPFLSFINMMENLYTSSYNALQVTLTKKPSHGLSFISGYTFSHALGSTPANQSVPLPQNSLQPQSERASLAFDIRHRLTFGLSYQVPGLKSPAHLLEGWQLNSIVTLQSGNPWGATDASDDISLTGEFSDRWNFFGNPGDFRASSSGPIPFFAGASNPACLTQAQAVDGGVVGGPTSQSLATFGCYAKGRSVLIPPAAGTFGTSRPNMFPGLGFHNLDLSAFKNVATTERLTVQLRAEFFNVLNHPNFCSVGSQLGTGCIDNDPSSPGSFGFASATPDAAAGNKVIGTGGSRAIQFGLKVIF